MSGRGIVGISWTRAAHRAQPADLSEYRSSPTPFAEHQSSIGEHEEGLSTMGESGNKKKTSIQDKLSLLKTFLHKNFDYGDKVGPYI